MDKRITIRLPEPLLNKIREDAEKHDMKTSQWIRYILMKRYKF